jgi:hypothetical protein
MENDMTDARAAAAADESWLKADDLLTREELAQILTHHGLPITVSTLSAMVTRGGGPPLQRWGRRPLYRWSLARAWASARLGADADVLEGRTGPQHQRANTAS